ncbi:sulfotransferase family protein [Desulfuribacillus alkaliarsenatis]|uniref:Sulfotransferase n=1 Tax=Desulfuribacillus alkaliarsenatis TaxID=766136 RepID=A0A1E5G1P4_9FIRM|nr:sulfotransferase [Desulfuribacillus alkaliarsenatis]OEF96830.1 hypothetical protein BHF68_07155 [Desulfuribacillus alkaliarsenatis]
MFINYNTNPIFVGGDGRSGTTLLSVIIDSHPDLLGGPELHFNGPKNLGSYMIQCLDLLIENDSRVFGKGLKENKELKHGVQFAKRCHRFGVEFIELKELVNEQMEQTNSNLETFEERCSLINAIGEFKRKQRDKKRWGIKIMREIRNIHVYSKIWPNAQYIHIIRDGRDVAASQMIEHGSWGYEDIKKAAKGWVDIIERTRKNAKASPLFEVKYEELVLEPRKTIGKIVDFLDVPWSDDLLKHSEKEHTLFENPYNHASIKQVVQPINNSSVGRFKRDLSIDQIEAFNKIAKKYLQEFEYEI